MTYSQKEPPAPVLTNARVFDQFKLTEFYGGDLYKSSMGMGILRALLGHKETGMNEGDLAARVGSRMFRPDWLQVLNPLAEQGYVTFKPVGKGVARIAFIAQKGLDFLEEKKIEVEPEPVEQPQEPEPVIHPTKDEIFAEMGITKE